MALYLGNLSVEQIERRVGIELTEEDREYMRNNRQERVKNIPLEHGKWHCYDMPFMIMVSDRETAEAYLRMFRKYDFSNCREALRIGYENIGGQRTGG